MSTTKFRPILMKRKDIDISVKMVDAKPIKKPSKIYIYKNFLFVGESKKGVHIIDNTNTTNPKNVGFLLIPGNEDIAIRNNVIFADNGTDIIAISMENPLTPVVTKRIKDVLNEKSPPDFLPIPTEFNKTNRPNKTIIIGWQ